MAKQVGDIKITGTVDGICFYKMQGHYYARLQSSLTGKRFWKDQAFAGSRESCQRLRKGSKLASEVYRQLPTAKQVYRMFCQLKCRAIKLLREGAEDDLVRLSLFEFASPAVIPVSRHKAYNPRY